MFNKRSLSLSLSLSLLSILLLSSCSMFGGNKPNPEQTLKKFEEQSQSAQKVLPEQYLPKNLILLASVSINDSETKENLDNLLKKFPGVEELKEAFWKGFRESSGEKAAEMEKDVRDLFGDTERLVFGVELENEQPVVHLAFVMKGTDVLNRLQDKLVKEAQFKEETKNGLKMLMNTDKGVYMSLKNDVLFVTSNSGALDKDLGRQPADSIYADMMFKQTLGALEFPALAYGYVLPGDAVKIIVAKAKDPKIKQAFDNDSFKILKALGASVVAQKDGLSLRFYEAGDKEVMDKAGFKFSTVKRPDNQPWLVSRLPDNQILFFEEAYNIRDALKSSFALNQTGMTPQAQETLKTVKAMVESATGLDLEKDLLDLLDKRILFALQYEKNNFMPALTILFDIAGHENSAEKVVGTLDKNIDVFLAQIKQSGAPANLLTKESVGIGGAKLQRLKVNVQDMLLDNPNIPPQAREGLKNLKIEFSYGITDKKEMILTTIADVESMLKNQETESGWLKTATDTLQANRKQDALVYVSIESMLGYVDDIVTLVDGIEPMSAKDKDSYEKVINAIKPIKYAVFGSEVEDYTVTGRGFVKIGE